MAVRFVEMITVVRKENVVRVWNGMSVCVGFRVRGGDAMEGNCGDDGEEVGGRVGNLV